MLSHGSYVLFNVPQLPQTKIVYFLDDIIGHKAAVLKNLFGQRVIGI